MIIIAKDGSCMASGSVTRKGGKMQYIGENSTPKLSFSICTKNEKGKDGKWHSKYQDCEVFGKRSLRIPQLTGEEDVFCVGTIRTSKYKGKDGEEKESSVLNCDFVMVSGNAAQNAAQMPMQEPTGFQESEEDFDAEEGDLPF